MIQKFDNQSFNYQLISQVWRLTSKQWSINKTKPTVTHPSGSSLESSAEAAVAKSETSTLRGLAFPRSRDIKLITICPRTVSLLSPLCRCNSIFWTENRTTRHKTHFFICSCLKKCNIILWNELEFSSALHMLLAHRYVKLGIQKRSMASGMSYIQLPSYLNCTTALRLEPNYIILTGDIGTQMWTTHHSSTVIKWQKNSWKF